MSNPGAGKLAGLSITGNATVDTVLRYGAVALCGVITGAITGWLNRAGFRDPNLVYYVGTGVATVLGGVLVAGWGAIRTSKNEAIIQIREAIAVQAGINVAENPKVPTPAQLTVPEAQKIIAEHATPVVIAEAPQATLVAEPGAKPGA